MDAGPSGTVTFLFTDIEGSTSRWMTHEAEMAAAVERHDELVRQAVTARGGYVFSTAGDGFGIAFSDADDAVAAAVEVQRSLQEEDWFAVDGLRVRTGLHTGTAHLRGGDYFGPHVSRAARIMSVAHGGQVVVSAATASLVQGVELVALGPHRLRDVPEPEELHQVLAAGLRREFPPLRSLDHVVSTLPTQRSSFIGREQEVAAVARLLRAERLVTLTGIGGTGKTRLAIEVAAREVGHVRDGVFFVDLTAASEPGQLPAVVAAGLALRTHEAAPVRDQVRTFLAARECLVVLDNCEHLVDAVASLADELLAVAPRLRLLATSREPLDVEGERTVRVASLSTASDVATSPAERLFLERATAVNPELTVDQDALSQVREICRRLDGIPLAIELAAARCRVLSPADVVEHLDDRFALLTGGSRRRQQRQHTLQATLDWSYDLLDPHEQRAFRQLAVFAGSFELTAAAAVLDVPVVRAVELLDALVAKSLVVCHQQRDATTYRLLETLRAYAEIRLVAHDEAAAARDRHLSHLLRHARPVGDPRGWNVDALREVARDYENLLGALDWAYATRRPDAVARLVEHLHPTWQNRACFGDGVQWVDRALEGDHDDEQRAILHHLRSWLSMIALDLPSMLHHADLAERLCRDPDQRAAPMILAHHALTRLGDPRKFFQRAERALEVARRPAHDQVALVLALLMHAYAALLLMDHPQAADDARAALRACRAVTPPADALVDAAAAALALALALDGQAEEAVSVARRPLADEDAIWSPSNEVHLALALAMAGEPDEAASRLVRTATSHGDVDASQARDALLVGFAVVRFHSGQPERARQLLESTVGVRTPVLTGVHGFYVTRDEGLTGDALLERMLALRAERFAPGWLEARAEVQRELLAQELAHASALAGWPSPAAGAPPELEGVQPASHGASGASVR